MTGAHSTLRIQHLYHLWFTGWLIAIAGACSSKTSSSSDAGVIAAVPPPISVTKDRQDLVFTFREAKTGEFSTATSVEQVPKSARRAVVVTDLSLSPTERQAGRYVYVTDLSNLRDDGSYPVAVASRYGFEAQVTDTSSVAGGPRREVVVYSASWCGVCRKTKRLLKQWDVPFIDKDVEASRKAQVELSAKAAQANIQPGGVPVIDVAGILLQGLDERQLRDALTERGFM